MFIKRFLNRAAYRIETFLSIQFQFKGFKKPDIKMSLFPGTYLILTFFIFLIRFLKS